MMVRWRASLRGAFAADRLVSMVVSPLLPLDTMNGAAIVKEEADQKGEKGGDQKGEDDANLDVRIAALIARKLSLVEDGGFGVGADAGEDTEGTQHTVEGSVRIKLKPVSVTADLRRPSGMGPRRGVCRMVMGRWDIHPPNCPVWLKYKGS